MLIHADFSQRALVLPHQHRWTPSPQAGVERVMLDRVGAEKGHATSLVRYAAGSNFPVHHHPGGEEILVLSGAFCEGNARYPAGWYLRNPPGSSHQPASPEGALLFVKLCQMPPDETQRVRLDTGDAATWTRVDGRHRCRLFHRRSEQVELQELAAGEALDWPAWGRVEALVLSGALAHGPTVLPAGTWWRSPEGDRPALCATATCTRVYVKASGVQP